MKKINLNSDWRVRPLSRAGEEKRVDLPHDAMLDEPRSPESAGEGHIGWYVGGDYEYTKTLSVPAEWAGRKLVMEFEGVYRDAEVFINERLAASRPYGYTNFYVDAAEYLRFGEDNEIRVIAHNAEQPNSRWYSGTGIYRPVSLWVGGEAHIPVNGVRVRTLDAASGEIEVHVRMSLPGALTLEILDGDRVLVSQAHTSKGRSVRFRVKLLNPKLWDTEHPHLYTARVRFGEDEVEETFGIRSLAWDTESGLTLNGQRVILLGACIHHDNGPLGACAFPEAEWRRIRLLKENGYNAIRSAHNPCSKALLEACDRLGMLVLDEYVDMWTLHKTRNDYATHMSSWWKQDLKDMVEKDYNHPSVIMYSTGNEVTETIHDDGIRLCGEMTEYLHKLDPTRPVTCGLNLFLNMLSGMGMGIYREEKTEGGKKKNRAVGSTFFNQLSGAMGERFMKWGATLQGGEVRSREAFARMDIAGYNYGIERYLKDLQRFPDRLILGTETFTKDIWQFWDMAQDKPRIVGDFVWTGFDYIGETNICSGEYDNYRLPDPSRQLTPGFGTIDITGRPRAEAIYARVVTGQLKGPRIAVKPVDGNEAPSSAGWLLTRAIPSWAWDGCEGRIADVEVYARAEEVELLLNGKSFGRKKPGKTCRAVFTLPWAKGCLTAIAYDKYGLELGRQSLNSAAEATELRLLPETDSIRPGALGYVRLRYTDDRGVWKPRARSKLKVDVGNGTLVGLCCGCAWVEGNYTWPITDTYYGEALAVVRAGEGGSVTVRVNTEGLEAPVSVEIPVLDAEPNLLTWPDEPDIPEPVEAEAPQAGKPIPEAATAEAPEEEPEEAPEAVKVTQTEPAPGEETDAEPVEADAANVPQPDAQAGEAAEPEGGDVPAEPDPVRADAPEPGDDAAPEAEAEPEPAAPAEAVTPPAAPVSRIWMPPVLPETPEEPESAFEDYPDDAPKAQAVPAAAEANIPATVEAAEPAPAEAGDTTKAEEKPKRASRSSSSRSPRKRKKAGSDDTAPAGTE